MRKLMLLAIMLALALVLAIPTVAQANNTGSFTNQQGAFGVDSTIDVEVDGSTSGNFTNNGGVSFTIGGTDNESGDVKFTNSSNIP